MNGKPRTLASARKMPFGLALGLASVVLVAGCGSTTSVVSSAAAADSPGASVVRLQTRVRNFVDSAAFCSAPGVETVKAIDASRVPAPKELPNLDNSNLPSPVAGCVPSKDTLKAVNEVLGVDRDVSNTLNQAISDAESSPSGIAALANWSRCINDVIGVKVSSKIELSKWIASEKQRLYGVAATTIDYQAKASANQAAMTFETTTLSKTSSCDKHLLGLFKQEYAAAEISLRKTYGADVLRASNHLVRSEYQSQEWQTYEDGEVQAAGLKGP